MVKDVKQVEIFSFSTYPPPIATQVVVLKSRLVQIKGRPIVPVDETHL